VIRQLREGKGWSQLQLARRSRVDQGYISRLEAGTKKNPSLAVLKKLAKTLDVEVGGLLG
jgi:transcriptional regulator with XRE-family HTH domain